ncbi:hypothetical protein ANCCAN_20879 [Ancylostoma caninum]|uniref:Uncharacterized protein n=1 Tax=Ancylostoma caninum TaxID=29170 RepID=A0A368FP43_ANCCA|nr:hypothetical protein ANCCAN_20879 [Ancylostoma caninum]
MRLVCFHKRLLLTVVAEKSRGVGVETEKAIMKDTAVGCKNVHHSSFDSGGAFHHITPAVAVGDREPVTTTTEMFAREERSVR